MQTENFQIKPRFLFLDYLKCLATFFVLSYHFTLYPHDIVRSGTVMEYIHYYFRTILSTCVPLFFFVNGFLLFEKELILGKHIRKTIHYVVLTFLWCGIYLFLIAGNPGRQYAADDLLDGFLSLDPSFGINIFWYMGALVCIYILFPALKALYDSNPKGLIFFMAAVALFSFGYGFANDIILFSKVMINRFATGTHLKLFTLEHPVFRIFDPFRGSYGYAFVYFCLGGFARRYLPRILEIAPGKRNAAAGVGLLVSCICLFLQGVFYSIFVDRSIWDVVWNGYDTIFTLVNVCALFLLSLNVKKSNFAVDAVSRHSLGIYATHVILGNVLSGICSRFISFEYLYQNILFTAVLMLLCVLFCAVLKKLPGVKYLI